MSEFDIRDIQEMDEDLHDMMYEWMLERVLDFYGVEELGQLTEKQIEAVELFANEEENRSGSLLAMKLHSIIYDWELENDNA